MQRLGPRILHATNGSTIDFLDPQQSAPEDLGHKWVKIAPNEVNEVNGKILLFSLFVSFSLCFRVLKSNFHHFSLEMDNAFASYVVIGDGLPVMMQNWCHI